MNDNMSDGNEAAMEYRSADSPFLGFEKILNFRDFGGYSTPNGRLKSGMLFRSAAHDESTEADLAKLATLGIGVIVDLRRPSERAVAPSRRSVNWCGHIIENDDPENKDAPHIAAIFEDHDPRAVRRKVIDYYRQAPFDPNLCAAFRSFFAYSVHYDLPVLIHCAAGKDRTGLFVALIQHALGVSYEDLLSDYLLTNAAGLHERLAPVAESIARAAGVEVLPPESRQAMLAADADYLAGAWSAICERYGSVDAYLEMLGLDGTSRSTLVKRLT